MDLRKAQHMGQWRGFRTMANEELAVVAKSMFELNIFPPPSEDTLENGFALKS